MLAQQRMRVFNPHVATHLLVARGRTAAPVFFAAQVGHALQLRANEGVAGSSPATGFAVSAAVSGRPGRRGR
jgi:hypothetical protein